MKNFQWFSNKAFASLRDLSAVSPGSGTGAYPATCKYASPNAGFMRAAQTSANVCRGSCDQVHTFPFAFVAAMEALMFNPAMSTSHGPEPMVQINITFVFHTQAKSFIHS